MDFLRQAVDVFLHLDQHLKELAGPWGPWLYVLLFVIVFCETGLVVTPFLPGDSLLFAVGALIARGDLPLNLPATVGLLMAAAILGDAVNYRIGYRIGPKVFKSESSWLLNKKHLLRTQHFYERYGGKTIILARFIPIIRTFAPFVAGIGKMEYRRFALYNVVGGMAWVLTFALSGYFVGDLPWVKDGFHYIIVAIILISVTPPVIEFVLARRRLAREKAALARLNAEPPVSNGVSHNREERLLQEKAG
ncbi:MAG TPA: DedA family protein [Gemmataceae bacterium]|nr:DedA family protein [Gemmataceae bacterium]